MQPAHFAQRLFCLLSLTWTTATLCEQPNSSDASREDDDGNPAAEREERLKQLETEGTSKIPEALQGPVQAMFYEVPVSKAVGYIAAANEIDILVERTIQAQPVTLVIERRPLRHVLEAISGQLEANWDADGYAIFVGRDEALKEFRRRLKTREARRKEYHASIKRPLMATLPRPMKIGSQPIAEVVKNLASVTNVPIQIADDEALRNQIVSLKIGKVPLDVALDLITLQQGLNWTVSEDGTVTISADEE